MACIETPASAACHSPGNRRAVIAEVPVFNSAFIATQWRRSNPLPRQHRSRVALSMTAFALCVAAALAVAQPAQLSLPSPVSAAPVALPYASVFAKYKPWRDEKTTSWREANDTVNRIGGWRAYAKEAQQPELPATQSPAAPSSSPPTSATAGSTPRPAPADPHAGHRSKP